jgi:hypothetical protein
MACRAVFFLAFGDDAERVIGQRLLQRERLWRSLHGKIRGPLSMLYDATYLCGTRHARALVRPKASIQLTM